MGRPATDLRGRDGDGVPHARDAGRPSAVEDAMDLYVATKNEGKLRELREIFGGFGVSLRTYAAYGDVAEGERSYDDNAALKADALAAQLRDAGLVAAALGDDSGIEVVALGDRPGVLSARYGGAGATWAQRRRALLDELADARDRRARFVCALHVTTTDGASWSARATYEGSIAADERGDGGFSYDAIFVAADGRTFAQMSDDEKNALSHRARAASLLVAAVRRDRPDFAKDAGKGATAGT